MTTRSKNFSRFQRHFLNNEIWILTFGGAFQRSNVYSSDISNDSKEKFKTLLKSAIDSLVKDQYQTQVTEEQHVLNIKTLATTYYIGKELIYLNFGIAQKLLNLYLKYQWCMGWLETPPHFPVDRLIQEKINKIARKAGLETRAVTSWTKFETENNYLEVIEFVKMVKNKDDELRNFSLAQIELMLFNRRSEK